MGSAPFHCPSCVAEFKQHGVEDITLDANVMTTLVQGIPPPVNPDEEARCQRVASWFTWDGSSLRLKDEQERIVVPICLRAQLVAQAAADLGYPGGDRLY